MRRRTKACFTSDAESGWDDDDGLGLRSRTTERAGAVLHRWRLRLGAGASAAADSGSWRSGNEKSWCSMIGGSCWGAVWEARKGSSSMGVPQKL